MKNKLGMISYTLATLASVCFVGGIFVLTGGEPSNAENRGDHNNH